MATTLVSPGEPPARLYRRVLWSPRAWGQALYLAGGIPAQVAAPLIVLGPAFVMKPRWLLPLAGLVVMFLAVPLLTQVQRHRLRTTAGVEIPPQPVIEHTLSVPGMVAAARSSATWRQIGYHLLVGPLLGGAAAAAFGMWLAGVLYTLVYTYAWALPRNDLLWRGWPMDAVSEHLPNLVGIPADARLTAGGIVLLVAAPWVTAGVAALDARAASALLGPSRAEELEHRVEHLTETRAGAVDAADAERRRLEGTCMTAPSSGWSPWP